MKRKVKFQEGGAVEESPRNRQLRERMEKFGREGRRIRGAERARTSELASRQAAGETGAERARAQRQNFSERVRAEAMRPPTSTPAASAARSRIAGGLLGAGVTAGTLLVPELARRGVFTRSPERQELVDAYNLNIPVEELRARRARNAPEPAPPPQADSRPVPADGPSAASMQSAPTPAAPAATPAATPAPSSPRQPPSRPVPRPAPAPAPRPRIREMTADELNEMELRRIRAERQMEEDDARERRRSREMMGGSGDIGAASARARGEQVGPPGDYNMKKGGIVKKKAGGMIAAKPKAAPKKMMKGGVVAKPKVAAKSKTKPMPFKKGGVIKKGKK